MLPVSDKPGAAKRYYNKTDWLYDLKNGHLQFDWTPRVTGSHDAVARNNAEFADEADAISLLTTGSEPLTRKDAQARPD